jgi:hypothetical protein
VRRTGPLTIDYAVKVLASVGVGWIHQAASRTGRSTITLRSLRNGAPL